MRFEVCVLLLLVLVLLPLPAAASDGVGEINHARALAGGITSGDAAGYPVTLSEGGSYILTGDLSPQPGESGITISAAGVSVNLNGFSIVGSGGSFADGIGIVDFDAEVRGGTIRGFSRNGIFQNGFVGPIARVIDMRIRDNTTGGLDLQGARNLIRGCTIENNGGNGVRTGGGSLIVDNIVQNNSGVGLIVLGSGGGAGFRGNVFTDNNSGGNQTAGGIEIGPNVCGANTTCP